jgi:hypothetical protein
MSEHVVGMYIPRPGEQAERARRALARVLGGDADVGAPDEDGTFEIRLDAADREEALQLVWDAVAAAGVDDEIVFAEHPDLPEHWRSRTKPSAR